MNRANRVGTIIFDEEDAKEKEIDVELTAYNKKELKKIDKLVGIKNRFEKIVGSKLSYRKFDAFDPDFKDRTTFATKKHSVKKGKWTSENITEKEFLDSFFKLGEAITGRSLHPYQRRPAERVVRCLIYGLGEVVTILYPRQVGKTEIFGQIIPTLMVAFPLLADKFPPLEKFKEGVKIGLFAPTSEQAKTMFDRIKTCIDNEQAHEVLKDPEIDIDISKDRVFKGARIVLPNGSICQMQSAAPQTKIESKSYNLVIIDEAQEMATKKIVKSIRPMLAHYNGSMVMTGTPNDVVSHFYETIMYNISRDYSLPARDKNHFQITWEEAGEHTPDYKEFVTREIERLGEDNDWIQTSYFLRWQLDKGMAITPEQFEKYMENKDGGIEIGGNSLCVAGIDLGKEQDSTVVTVCKLVRAHVINEYGVEEEKTIKYVINWLEMRNVDWKNQVKSIYEFLSMYPMLECIAVDATGKGEPIVESLQEPFYGQCSIIPVVLSRKLNNNLTQLFYKELWNNRIRIPATPDTKRVVKFRRCKEEFINCEKITKNGFVKLQHSTKKESHDDYVYSLLLTLYAAEKIDTEQIYSMENVFFSKDTGGKKATEKMRKRRAKIDIFKNI